MRERSFLVDSTCLHVCDVLVALVAIFVNDCVCCRWLVADAFCSEEGAIRCYFFILWQYCVDFELDQGKIASSKGTELLHSKHDTIKYFLRENDKQLTALQDCKIATRIKNHCRTKHTCTNSYEPGSRISIVILLETI